MTHLVTSNAFPPLSMLVSPWLKHKHPIFHVISNFIKWLRALHDAGLAYGAHFPTSQRQRFYYPLPTGIDA